MSTAKERLAHWRDFWGDPEDRPNPYGTRNAIYTEGYHRGEDISNGGRAERVPALRSGEIIDFGVSAKIGPWVCVLPDETLFDRPERDIYCHMSTSGLRNSGRIEKAEDIGSTAGWGEFGGSAWRGPHLHFVVAADSHGGFDVDVVDYDPRPIIRAALEGKFDPKPAQPKPAGEAKPAPAPAPIREEITMRMIYNTEDFDEETRRACVGETSFEVQGEGAFKRERKLWADPLPVVNVTQAEWNGILASVNKRRAQNGRPALKGVRGEK